MHFVKMLSFMFLNSLLVRNKINAKFCCHNLFGVLDMFSPQIVSSCHLKSNQK